MIYFLRRRGNCRFEPITRRTLTDEYGCTLAFSCTCQPFLNGLISMILTSALHFPPIDLTCSLEHDLDAITARLLEVDRQTPGGGGHA